MQDFFHSTSQEELEVVLGDESEPRKRIGVVLDKFGLIFDVSCGLMLVHGKGSCLCIFGLMNPEANTSGPFKIITTDADLLFGRPDGHRRHTIRQGLGTRVVEIGGEKVILKAGHFKILLNSENETGEWVL